MDTLLPGIGNTGWMGCDLLLTKSTEIPPEIFGVSDYKIYLILETVMPKGEGIAQKPPP